MIYLFLIVIALSALLYAFVAVAITFALRSHTKPKDVSFVSTLTSQKINLIASAGMASLTILAGLLLTLSETRRCSQIDDDACYMGLFILLIPIATGAFFFLVLTAGLWLIGRMRRETQGTSILSK